MFFVYVDESGDPGMSSAGMPTGSSDYFLRAAILIPKDSWFKINTAIKEFRAAEGIPSNIEFHAVEIHRGSSKRSRRLSDGKSKKITERNFWGRKYRSAEERKDLIKRYLHKIVIQNDLKVVTVAICKRNINLKQFTNNNEDHHLKNRSLNFLTERINEFVGYRKAKALLIFDHVDIVDDSKHRNYQRTIYRNSHFINNQNFIETMCFAPSQESELLQLADIISNTAFRYYSSNERDIYSVLKPAIFKEKVWPEKD